MVVCGFLVGLNIESCFTQKESETLKSVRIMSESPSRLWPGVCGHPPVALGASLTLQSYPALKPHLIMLISNW